MPQPSTADLALALAAAGCGVLALTRLGALSFLGSTPSRRRVRVAVVLAGVVSMLTGSVMWLGAMHRSGEELTERRADYRAAVGRQLHDRYGLRPLSVDARDLPDADDVTVDGVRMERDDELLQCVLNTRTGAASVTAHCRALDPRDV